MKKNEGKKTEIHIQSLIKHLIIVQAGEGTKEIEAKVKAAVLSALNQCRETLRCNSDKYEQP